MLLPAAAGAAQARGAATLARRLQRAAGAAPHQSPAGPWRAAAARAAAAGAGSSGAGAQAPAAGADEQQAGPPHVSVLLAEVLDALNHMPIRVRRAAGARGPAGAQQAHAGAAGAAGAARAASPRRAQVFVDCTLGAGGHTAAMVQQHPELEVAVGIDVDPTAHALADARLAPLTGGPGQPALRQLRGNYSDVASLLSGCDAPGGALVGRVDAMLMDLGVSSMQIDEAGRGFSFMADGPLDMRMDPGAARSAEELVNAAPEAELGRILRDYGEEKAWRAVAARIVAAREAAPIRTTRQLVEVALRIAVNDEIARLERALPAALGCLSPGGRLAVISFHSLEDRAVKHALLAAAGRPTPAQEALVHGPDGWRVLEALAASAQGRVVTRKPVVPGGEETAANPRARSAKLRVFERAGGPPGSDERAQRGGKRQRLRREAAAASGAVPRGGAEA
ncbi:rsmH [Scenedesmus sp. PABB004]|nr:rsmH [Scenedesmus sp. PABB004]